MTTHNYSDIEELGSEEDDYLEIPSCIESLVNSAEQLQQLAQKTVSHYVRLVLYYGYYIEPKHHTTFKFNDGKIQLVDSHTKSSNNDENKESEIKNLINDPKYILSMDVLVNFLPHLNELSSFIEGCLTTIESALKRATYYLNKCSKHNSNNVLKDGFQLTSDVKMYPIFVALMDLIFALVCLNETIRTHTNINNSLEVFSYVCKLAINSHNSDDGILDETIITDVTKERLEKLLDFITNIKITLCREGSSLFKQCIEHFQRLNLILSSEKTSNGYQMLCENFEDFIIFYGENLIESEQISEIVAKNSGNMKYAQIVSSFLITKNIVPSLYMNSSSRKVFGLTALFILYTWISKKQDKKVLRSINQMLNRIKSSGLILHLEGSNGYVFLHEFLNEYMPKPFVDGKILNRFESQVESLLKLDTNAELGKFTAKVKLWLNEFRMESSNPYCQSESGWPTKLICLLDQGLKLTDDINSTVKSILNVYLHYDKPMSKNNHIPLMRLVSLLKSIDAIMRRHVIFIEGYLIKIEQTIRLSWRRLFSSAQRRLASMKYSERKLDIDSILTLTFICSRPSFISTYYGRIMLSICLSMMIPLLELDEINGLCQLWDLFRPSFYSKLDSVSNCAYLYWNISTIGIYYNQVFEEFTDGLNELNHFHSALDDIPSLFAFSDGPTWSKLDCNWILDRQEQSLKQLNDELMDQLKSDFLDKLCQEFEMELRLQTHRDLYVDGLNPFKRHMYDFNQIFKSKNPAVFKIINQIIDIRYYVEEHLNKVCYNLTSIAPHDWFIYDNMINLARHKYQLEFVNTQLPAQTLDSGLDLLDITRNLGLFASRYTYDLSGQLFIEKCSSRSSATSLLGTSAVLSSYASSSSNQSLNVIQIEHISQSIQTHGYGLLDSSVNCTYQTLKKLINLFSKQLSDDKLCATLRKEHQLILANSTKEDSQSVLTFDKANQMAKRFKLSSSSLSDSSSRQLNVDLDSLRQTITQLGNLLAFIRLLKSGALNCASKSVDYVPDLEKLSSLKFADYVDKEFHGYETDSLRKASENFDQCLADLGENFTPKTNYIKIIVDLFTSLLSCNNGGLNGNSDNGGCNHDEANDGNSDTRDTTTTSPAQLVNEKKCDNGHKRDHLRLFFIVVPALTINYIDYLINCKERVASRSSTTRLGAIISDDGFSMGVAFLLTVLGQTKDYIKFEWLKQVLTKLLDDRREVEERLKDVKYEESLRQTSSMTLRRLNRLYTEYSGLEYTLNSALLLFRSSTMESAT